MSTKKKSVLFLCTHNSARSQMAEGLLKTLYGRQYEAYSAGMEPTHLNPYAVEVLKDIGIDISNYQSKYIKQFQERDFDYVVTVCNQAKEICPFFPGKKVIHKGFLDPAAVDGSIDEILFAFRSVRDEIRDWINQTFGEK